MTEHSLPAAVVERVRETLDPTVPALVHDGWRAEMPWLVQGTTTRGAEQAPFDLGLFGRATRPEVVREHWNRLFSSTGVDRGVCARQVHGQAVRTDDGGADGLYVADDCDGHATASPGVLLAVTVADCVPVFVVAPTHRAVAVLHAGWRGAAAGVLEEGLSILQHDLGASPEDLSVHLGPSICGDCYEVGPEVWIALDQAEPDGPLPIDLRAILAVRAATAGVPTSAITISTHCTRCTDSGLFSHRGGDPERQVGYLGIRD